MDELIKLCKQALSIVETATLKDNEIKMWIQAGILDLQRQGIKADETKNDNLVTSAIVMFVKGNFGNVDIKEKELAQERYSLLCANLGASQKYLEEEENV